MPRIELSDIRIGVSPHTDTVYAGTLDPKDKTLSTWRHHHDVSRDFYRSDGYRWPHIHKRFKH